MLAISAMHCATDTSSEIQSIAMKYTATFVLNPARHI